MTLDDVVLLIVVSRLYVLFWRATTNNLFCRLIWRTFWAKKWLRWPCCAYTYCSDSVVADSSWLSKLAHRICFICRIICNYLALKTLYFVDGIHYELWTISVLMIWFGQSAMVSLNIVIFCRCHVIITWYSKKYNRVLWRSPTSQQFEWNICSLKPYVSGSHDWMNNSNHVSQLWDSWIIPH